MSGAGTRTAAVAKKYANIHNLLLTFPVWEKTIVIKPHTIEREKIQNTLFGKELTQHMDDWKPWIHVNWH